MGAKNTMKPYLAELRDRAIGRLPKIEAPDGRVGDARYGPRAGSVVRHAEVELVGEAHKALTASGQLRVQRIKGNKFMRLCQVLL